MRIYREEEFLLLPEGTMYCKGKEWIFESIAIKGKSLCKSWYMLDPCWIEGDTPVKRLNEMLATGASYPMESAEARDDCFCDDEIFLVFEKADLVIFADLVATAIKKTALE